MEDDPLASLAAQGHHRKKQQQQQQQQQPQQQKEVKVLPKPVAKGPVIESYSSVHNSITGHELSITKCTTTVKESNDVPPSTPFLPPPPSLPQPAVATVSPP